MVCVSPLGAQERFFEGFALAFSSADNVAFTLRVLTEWLSAASVPLLAPNALMPHRPSMVRLGLRSRAELQRVSRPTVAALYVIHLGLLVAPAALAP